MNVWMIEIAAICGIVIFAIIVSTLSYFQDAGASSIFDLFKNFFSKKSKVLMLFRITAQVIVTLQYPLPIQYYHQVRNVTKHFGNMCIIQTGCN
jgi:hypothetical protein